MAIEKINFSYPSGTLQSIFEGETKTALELSALTAKKVDECIELVNGVEQIAIQATAIVDEMRLAQDQFITENADVRAQLVNDNQDYLDGLQTAFDAYEASLNTSKTVFETTINNAISAFQTDANADLDAFEASIESAKTNYQNSANQALTDYQTALNTSKTTYETNMTNALNTFKSGLDTEKASYTTALNTIVSNGETAVENIGTSVITEVSNKVNTMVNDGSLGSLINTTLLGEINTELDNVGLNTNKNTDDIKRIITVLHLVENTDVSTQLNTAFANMVEGESIRIPKGTYNINHVILEPKKYCVYDFSGATFKSIATSGIAFKIGKDTEQRYGGTIYGLDIINNYLPNIAFPQMVTALQMVNINDFDIHIKRVEGFYKNVECIAKNNFGFGMNRIRLMRTSACKFGLYMTAESGGWVNENTFISGEFQYTSACAGLLTDTDYLLYIDHNTIHNLNNNHFYSPSFEGIGNDYGHAFYVDGWFNQITNCRIEAVGNGILGSNGKRNQIVVGYDNFVENGAITDNGVENTVECSHFLKKGGGSPRAVFEAQHYAGGSFKNYSGKLYDGTETFSVDSFGNMKLKGDIEFTGGVKGLILLDTSSGIRKKLVITNGAIVISNA